MSCMSDLAIVADELDGPASAGRDHVSGDDIARVRSVRASDAAADAAAAAVDPRSPRFLTGWYASASVSTLPAPVVVDGDALAAVIRGRRS